MVSRESAKIAQITDQISALAVRADSTVASTGPVVKNVNRTIDNANNTIGAIRDPLVRNLTDLERTITQARSLIADVNAVVRINEVELGDTLRNLQAT